MCNCYQHDHGLFLLRDNVTYYYVYMYLCKSILYIKEKILKISNVYLTFKHIYINENRCFSSIYHMKIYVQNCFMLYM